MLIMLRILEEIKTLIEMIIKFPLRIICHMKHDHKWECHNDILLFEYKYTFTCKRCGCRCTRNINKLNKKGFKGTAKIK